MMVFISSVLLFTLLLFALAMNSFTILQPLFGGHIPVIRLIICTNLSSLAYHLANIEETYPVTINRYQSSEDG